MMRAMVASQLNFEIKNSNIEIIKMKKKELILFQRKEFTRN